MSSSPSRLRELFQRIDQRADGWNERRDTILNGRLMRDELRWIAAELNDILKSFPSESGRREFEEKPVAWLIERPRGTGKQQTVEREVVLSPLTDDTFLDEGDAAYPLFREVYTQEQLDAANAEAKRLVGGLKIE